MSKKEKLHQSNPQMENAPEATAAPVVDLGPDGAPDTSPALAELEKHLAEAESQVAEYKDGWQRSVADFQNYRRRVEAEKVETYQNAVGSIIKRYLPILDDLERALATRPADLAWVDGIELIYRKLKFILESEGLKRIEAEGQMFDPNFHEAIQQEPSEDYESGRIISVVQNGYTLGEKIIRPAVVRVAK
jgi:molecular chaperone GrpE